MDDSDDTKAESCGRCAMTSVVDMADDGTDRRSSPFDGDRIEIEDAQLRTASAPMVLAGRVKRRVDELALRIIHGR